LDLGTGCASRRGGSALRLQVGEHGAHPTVIFRVRRQVQLGEDPSRAGLDGLVADDQRVGHSAGPLPS
jgi:hypothetical protein